MVVGSVNADTALQVERIPRPGETVTARSSQVSAGGKGANQACAVVRAGADCLLVGAVGADRAGDLLSTELGRRGVALEELVRLPDVESGAAVVLVDDRGENCIVVVGGANAALSPSQVTSALDRVPDAGLVLTQGELSVGCVEAAAAWAVGAGIRFVHNLAPYRGVTAGLLAVCDPLVVNEHEAADLARSLGRPTDDVDELLSVLPQHCRSVVLTLGGAGAAHASPAGTGHVPAEPVDVVDTTGAGDAFVGALAAALLTDDDLARAVRAGVAAGATAVQHPGALPPI